ncbi:MAG: hypothetical protein IT368_14715 [Candidatus Hydrogenedentes bacterium]|nr:hypothetical protein [Candidatus Hydrogenedentota bacterium]
MQYRLILMASMLIPCAAMSETTLLFENSNFEKGTLENWLQEGSAFEFQPTRGDNVLARTNGQTREVAGHEGQWWAGSFEKYQGQPGEAPGQTQGDNLTGGLLSADFIIRQPYLTFLVGGGAEDCSVNLIVSGEVVFSTSGRNQEEMKRVYWNVQEFHDRKGMIYVQDSGRGRWGHINVDDFRASDAGPRLLFPNSDFEMGDLTNWTAEGLACTSQPTKGDNVAVRSREKKVMPQGQWWVGTYENFQGKAGQPPGQVQDDLPRGILRSIPFTITENTIAFLVGGGKGDGVAIRMKVDEQVIHTTRGQNAELLQSAQWDVSTHKGKTAVIEIIDEDGGAWGHINADYFHYAE